MPVFVYKRIAAQPFQIALAQPEKLVQFRRFAAITTALASAALELTGCTNRLANILDCNARSLTNRHKIVMNRGCRFALGFKLLFVALDFVLSDFAQISDAVTFENSSRFVTPIEIILFCLE